MAMFKGFKPQGMQKIATRMGYAGSMEKFDDYLKQNPDKEREMIVYRSKAQEMARGGSVRKFQQGGFNPFQVGTQAVVYGPDGTQYGNGMIAERAGVTDYSYTQPSIMEQFPIADFQPMPQQVDTPTGLPLKPGMEQQVPGFPETASPNTNVGNTRMSTTNLPSSGAPVSQQLTDPRGLPQQNIPQLNVPKDSSIGELSAQQAITPGLPSGGTTVPVGTQLTQEQVLAPTSGQLSGTVSVPTAMAQTTMAQQPIATTANVMDAQGVAEQVNTSLDTLQAAQTDELDPRA